MLGTCLHLFLWRWILQDELNSFPIQSFYKYLYNKRQQNNSKFNFFDESIDKLSNIDQTKCEGLKTESEYLNALKCMKNKKKALAQMA